MLKLFFNNGIYKATINSKTLGIYTSVDDAMLALSKMQKFYKQPFVSYQLIYRDYIFETEDKEVFFKCINWLGMTD